MGIINLRFAPGICSRLALYSQLRVILGSKFDVFRIYLGIKKFQNSLKGDIKGILKLTLTIARVLDVFLLKDFETLGAKIPF